MAAAVDNTPGDILVVDGDSRTLEQLTHSLRGFGHRVREALSGEACLDEMVLKIPDLILCDQNLPGIRGIDVLRRVKGNALVRHVPVLMMSEEDNEDERLEAIEAGAADFLIKPVNMPALMARSRSVLRSKRLNDEVRRQRQILDSLFEISLLGRDDPEATLRIFTHFAQRVTDLLQTRQAVILLGRGGEVPEVLASWPNNSVREVTEKVHRCEAVQQILALANSIVVAHDDPDHQGMLGLDEGFAGVPIMGPDNRVIGAVVAFGTRVNPSIENFRLLSILAQRVGAEVQMRDYNEVLEQRVAERTRDLTDALDSLQQAQEDTIFRLALAADFRDNETGNHLRRISRLSALLAKSKGLPDEAIELLRHASQMHDVGKVGIPDAILLKPGKLTDDEWVIMRQHPALGAQICHGAASPLLQMSEKVAMGHHERWDGNGYPNGAKGEEIPIESRIVAVVDIFDALTSRRPYKEPWPYEKAFAHIESLAGNHLDPELVDLFLQMREDAVRVKEDLTDDAPQDLDLSISSAE